MKQSEIDRLAAMYPEVGLKRRRKPGKDPLDWGLGFGLSFVILCGFLLTSPKCEHWFILPAFGCGLICASEAICWLREKWDTFDPRGAAGAFGFHVLFLAPLLHVSWDVWAIMDLADGIVPAPQDMRPWLGWMGVLNLIGLILYQVTQAVAFSRVRPIRSRWQIRRDIAPFVLIGAILFSCIGQVVFWSRMGGIRGLMETYSARKDTEEVDEFRGGLGYVMMVSDSLPILLLLAGIIGLGHCQTRWRRRGLLFAMSAGAAFFVVQFLAAGLRGSRSLTIFALIWAMGMIHFFVHRLRPRLLVLGLIPLVLFAYGYAYYKSMGIEALDLMQSKEKRSEARERTGLSTQFVLLGDMGRADLQAYVLCRLSQRDVLYDYARGKTYIAGLFSVVPRPFRPLRIKRKIWETDALYGVGAFDDGKVSSRVFGLGGEALLNFGPIGVPLAFAVWGAVMGLFRGKLARWEGPDMRLLMAPAFLRILSLSWLIGDFELIVLRLFKDCFIPFVCIVLMTRRVPVSRSDRQKSA